MNIFTVEINCLDENNSPKTLYFSSDTYITKPTESLPNLIFNTDLNQIGNFKRDLVNGSQTFGNSKTDFGEITINNLHSNPKYDYLINYTFDGYAFVIKYGNQSDLNQSFSTLYSGIIAKVLFEFDKVVFVIQDRSSEFQLPLQTNKYLGNNILPDGTEGDENFKDKLKPLVFGLVKNIPATLINNAKLIYQISDGSIYDILKVYDKGVSLTRGADYTNLDDLNNNSPTASQFRVLKSMGMFRIGTVSQGNITCDSQSRSLNQCTAGYLIQDIITKYQLSYSNNLPINISTNDLNYIKNNYNQQLGIYSDGQTTASQLLDDICNSVGIWWGFDRHSELRFNDINQFSNQSPLFTIHDFDDVLSFEIISIFDSDKGIPIYKITLNYDYNYTVQQDTELGGDKASANDPVGGLTRRNWLKMQTRQIINQDDNLKRIHKLSTDLTFETKLINQADAQTIANILFNRFNQKHLKIKISLKLNDLKFIDNIDVGKTVLFDIDRLGLKNKVMVILSYEVNLSNRSVDLVLYK